MGVLSPFRSVRARFSAGMGVLGLVFGLLLAGIIEWRIERELRAAARGSLQSIATSIAQRLNEDLGNRHREVALMADLLSNDLITSDAITKVIDGLKSRQPIYAWIGLTDRKGEVLTATDGLLIGQNVAARPWFSAALQGGFLGDPHEAKLLAPHMKPGAEGEPQIPGCRRATGQSTRRGNGSVGCSLVLGLGTQCCTGGDREA